MLEFRGSLQGETARSQYGFTYCKPVLRLDRLRPSEEASPERVYPDREYPRWTSKVPASNFETVFLADYVLKVGAIDSTGYRQVEVWLMPNQVTRATEPALKLRGMVAAGLIHLPEIRDELLRRAFLDAPKPDCGTRQLSTRQKLEES